MGEDIKYENQIEQLSWNYIKLRSQEIKKQKLTVRLVLDFQKGVLGTVQDQAIVSGVSSLSLYLDKIIA